MWNLEREEGSPWALSAGPALFCLYPFFQFLPESQQISLTVPAPNHLSPDFQLFSLWLVFPAVVLALTLLAFAQGGAYRTRNSELTVQIPPRVPNALETGLKRFLSALG